MSGWRALRKTGTPVCIAYGHTSTNNLTARNFECRADAGFELRLDLSGNLRTRARTSNCRIDAQDLADGGVAEITLVQISEEGVVTVTVKIGCAPTLQAMGIAAQMYALQAQAGSMPTIDVEGYIDGDLVGGIELQFSGEATYKIYLPVLQRQYP